MVKNTKYILFRIIIGVGIAFVLGLFTNLLDVNAQGIYTIDTNLTSMHDMNSQQTYTYTPPTNTFKNLGRGEILLTYYMTDYSDFNATSTTTTALLRYVYVSTYNGNNYICNVGSVGYQKLSDVYAYNNTGSTIQANFKAMTAVYSVTCPVELTNDDYVTGFTAWNVGVQPNTFVQFSRYISFITDNQAEIVAQQEETNSILQDDSVDEDNASSSITSMQGEVATNGSITQLLTLPITLYQAILNSISGSCSAWNLGSLFNHNIILPCINLQNLLGSTIWGVIDILCSGLFILSFRKKLVDIFNHMTSLNDRGNELE